MSAHIDTFNPNRTVTCPVCQAPVGQYCVSLAAGKPLSAEHVDRHGLAGHNCPDCPALRYTAETLRVHRAIAHGIPA